MSLHRSLKTKPAALNQHRNVLTRAERIEQLTTREKFNPEDDTPLGLPKVANRQVVTKKKQKKEDTGGIAESSEAGETPAAAE